MQIICPIDCLCAEYYLCKRQESLRPPDECPHCCKLRTLRALGYYERDIADEMGVIIKIRVRRFRCCICGKTVSLLPSFAQPYKVVDNKTIVRFFSGECRLVTSVRRILIRYWRKFCRWLPDLLGEIRGFTGLPPPSECPMQCWNLFLTWGGSLGEVTLMLTKMNQITLFGRYRCHSSSFSSFLD